MQGTTLSGGDRIFIELTRRWSPKYSINLLISYEGWQICKRERLPNLDHKIWSSGKFNRYGYFINYFYRTFISIIESLTMKIDRNTVVYSSSDFWPDSLPALILKLKFKNKIRWIAGFYLFAPKLWGKESPYKGKRFLRGLFYYLTQLPIYWVVKRYADMVFVTSEPDVEKFITKKRDRGRIVVVRGGVDTKPSTEYLSSGKIIPMEKRKYDACFVGRFHPQKGVLELIHIWKLVCEKKPDAKLAMIGAGPLEEEVKNKVAELRLNNNVELLGFKDGEEKYDVFRQSKIIVHPATYDSGGMAAAEGMAWGLPGMSFDLEALRTYYPKGMIKAPYFDSRKFADNIVKLLRDKQLYDKTKEDAIAWAKEWDWQKRTEELLKVIERLVYGNKGSGGRTINEFLKKQK